jgi:hypothetical protein
MEKDRSVLADKEPHPSVEIARTFLLKKMDEGLELYMWQEALASCAIEGNRLAEVCLGTLNRLVNKEPVSDRYFMGLILLLIREDLLK